MSSVSVLHKYTIWLQDRGHNKLRPRKSPQPLLSDSAVHGVSYGYIPELDAAELERNCFPEFLGDYIKIFFLHLMHHLVSIYTLIHHLDCFGISHLLQHKISCTLY